MPLIAVRKLFYDLTGRADLVDPNTLQNKGADFYIREGQKWLEQKYRIRESYSRRFVQRVAGSWSANGEGCRVITAVWMSTHTEKWRLSPIAFDELVCKYPQRPETIQPGKPEEYAVAVRRSDADAPIVPLSVIDWWGPEMFGQNAYNFRHNGLVWRPPNAEEVTLEIHGIFPHYTLNHDIDQNFWSEEHPMVLALSAARFLEMGYRNFTGVQDYEKSIHSTMDALTVEWAEQEAVGIVGYEG